MMKKKNLEDLKEFAKFEIAKIEEINQKRMSMKS